MFYIKLVLLKDQCGLLKNIINHIDKYEQLIWVRKIILK